MSTRFVLRRTGKSEPGVPSQVALPRHLDATAGVQVLDETPRMLLVDASRKVLDRALKGYSDWEVVPETFTPLPDPRVQITRKR